MQRTTTAALALAALMPFTALAQSPSDWQFRASLYAYLPSIGGNLAFPVRSGDASVTVHPDNVLDELNFAFMGTFEANNGRFGVFTDFMYLDVSGSRSGGRDFQVGNHDLPASVTGDLDLTIKGTAWTIAGEYRVTSSPEFTMDALLGARLLDVRPKLSWSLAGDVATIPTAGRAGNYEIKANNWDAIVGVKGRYAFGDRRAWFVPFYADVGTGESDLTWQAAAGLGYAFGWGDVLALWRYLGYNMKSGQAVEDINFNGPMIGVTFKW
jgi:hypothetical protein